MVFDFLYIAVMPTDCTFGVGSTGTFCDWKQPVSPAVFWETKHGQSVTPDTGPDGGYGGTGRYALVTSSGQTGAAMMMGPWMTYNASKNAQLTIAYNMYGKDVVNLTVGYEMMLYDNTVGLVPQPIVPLQTYQGDQGQGWNVMTIDLAAAIGGKRCGGGMIIFRIHITAFVDGSDLGDIAIDSIMFSSKPASKTKRNIGIRHNKTG